MEAAELTIRVDGVALHVREWPARGRPVMLLHGLASTSHIWDLVGPRLARAGLRTVAIDQRGHGRSGKPASGYGFARMTADAATVMRRLGLQRPVIVGHSWGANVALELVVRRPRSVRGAVLVDGGFLALRDRMDWATTREVLAPPDLAGMRVERLLGFVRRHLGPFVEITPTIERIVLSQFHVDRVGRIRPRLSRANHLRILRGLWEQDTRGLLRRTTRPMLIVAARPPASAGDRPEFLEAKRRGRREVEAIGPPLRFEWMDGIHDLPLQRPDALARRIVHAARS